MPSNGVPADRKGQSVAAAYEALRDLIVSGRLGPGSRLVERDLADYLGVSRAPVRSALMRLLQEGYGVSLAGERARLVVAPLTRADAQQLYSLLGFLDGSAAAYAASLESPARDEVVQNLKRTAGELDEVAGQVPFDARRFFDLDYTFHHHYIDLPDTPRLRSLYDVTRPQADRYRLFYTSGAYVGALEHVAREHAAIVEAIESGDPEAAERAARKNWEAAAERVSSIMEIAGERGNL